jgi:non-canonical poly(A) RNA polymerase PAPD5/7
MLLCSSLIALQALVGNSVYRGGVQYKFSILDPNNPENDIAGGSSNTAAIRDFFSQAYNDLQTRMGELQYSYIRKNECLLGCILAGNYKTFKMQRDHLQHIYDKLFGPVLA